jgi:NADP-dependent 3-hydroxy acid dehydrogenase YdfG
MVGCAQRVAREHKLGRLGARSATGGGIENARGAETSMGNGAAESGLGAPAFAREPWPWREVGAMLPGMDRLDGQVFVVTGGKGAIGGAVVSAFEASGARAIVAGLPEVDVLDAASAERLVSDVLAREGRLDGVIHTVGGFAMARVHEARLDDYDRLFDLNVRSLFYVARAVVPHFLGQRRGFLAAFSSEPGWTGASPGSALYGAAKAAVATFLRSLDGELTGTDARVAIVYPMGAVDTPANRRDMPSFDRFIDPRDIAETIVHAAQRSRAGRLLELAVYPPR